MRMIVFLLMLSGPVYGQESVPSLSDTDFSGVFSGSGLFNDFGDGIEIKSPPQAYAGCLVDTDGVTPLICASSDQFRPMPDGFEWRNDTEADPYEPRHCLFWLEGDEFVGHPRPAVCREGEVSKEDARGNMMKF